MQRPRDSTSSLRAQQGTLMLGLMVGMLVGLALAVVVAIFVTRAPLPFVNKMVRGGERLAELSKPGAEVPDPNRSLASVPRPPVLTPETAPVPGSVASAPVDPSSQPAVGATADSGTPAVGSERGLYVLQAGAFRSSDDADNMRAKLALIGFEARVSAAEVGSERLYRVRIGPYSQQDDVNLARFRLAENGIEATVVRQR